MVNDRWYEMLIAAWQETLEALFADPAEQDRRGCDAAAKARIAQWLPDVPPISV
jgi:hypothetical protein